VRGREGRGRARERLLCHAALQVRAAAALDRLSRRQAVAHQQLALADRKAGAALKHLEALAGQPGSFLGGLQGVDGAVQRLGSQALRLQQQLAQLQAQVGARQPAAGARQ
jgi:hypothetical protein